MTEIVGSALKGGVRGMYMMGENPFLSDPNVNKVRKALAALEFLVVQDIFLTETAEFADVVLPATSFLEKDGTYTNTDRRVQIGRKVLDPPGEARPDWEIIREIATRIGLPMEYESVSEVFDEMVALSPAYAGLEYDNLGPTGQALSQPGPRALRRHGGAVRRVVRDRRRQGAPRARGVDAGQGAADEEYPFVLNTGRLLEHWHTGSMTRRSFALDAIQPTAMVFVAEADAAAHGHRRRRLRARDLAPRLDRAGGEGLAPGDARLVLHPVPLPRGGGEPADDRRDRPVREDPRVQVLRRQDRDDGRRGDVLPDSEQALQGAG